MTGLEEEAPANSRLAQEPMQASSHGKPSVVPLGYVNGYRS